MNSESNDTSISRYPLINHSGMPGPRDEAQRQAPSREPDGLGDRELVTRARSGDEAAWDELARRHGPTVLDVARDYTGNIIDADDATQITMLVAITKIASLRDPSRIRPWLKTIAKRESLKLRRRRARELHSCVVSADVPGSDKDSARLMMDRERDERINLALARVQAAMPKPYAAFSLHFGNKMSAMEVGEILGIPEATVRSRCHAVRERLREVLADMGFEP